MWIEVLEAGGASVTALDSRHVRLQVGAEHQDYFVAIHNRRMSPSEISGPSEVPALLVAPTMSAAAAETAYRHGWSVITDAGPSQVSFRGRTLDLHPAGTELPAGRPARRGRPGYSLFAVLRALLSVEGDITQNEVARFVGVTQPRVSQTLRHLRDENLVRRDRLGWTVTDRGAAIDWWVSHYPGPGGIRSSWFGLDPPMQQAHQAYRLLEQDKARPVVSGDVAADLVAPWRVPQHALLYAERGLDLGRVGLTPAAPGDATLTLVLPADQSVWPLGGASHLLHLDGVGDVARASALQVLFDLVQSPGSDAAEAADRWRSWMLNGPVEA